MLTLSFSLYMISFGGCALYTNRYSKWHALFETTQASRYFALKEKSAILGCSFFGVFLIATFILGGELCGLL